MPLGAGHHTVTTADKFIPELWSDEVIATYEKALIARNLVTNWSWVGKKGDAIHIPRPGRASASQKVAQTQVSLNADTATETIVYLNQHWEVSQLIEDIVKVQALDSMRQHYTRDMGYALARQVDSFIFQLGRKVNGGSGTNAYTGGLSGADGTTAYVAGSNTGLGALTDVAIRRTIQRLDDNDVPMDGRFLAVPPSARNTLMGIARFTEQAFVGEQGSANTIRNGEVGNVYGVPVFISNNVDTTSGTTAAKVCLFGHRDFAVFVEQQGVRTQTQYKQEYLADLMTADTIYGGEELRDSAAVALIVPA